MGDSNPIIAESRSEWRKWLSINHREIDGVWLTIFKKHSSKAGITLAEAVEEAICYGWIDSKMKSIDKDKFILKFSQRKMSSVWSEGNKKKAIAMIRKGMMTKAGMEKIEEAKANGKWKSAYSSKKGLPVPSEVERLFKKDPSARESFNRLANNQKLQYLFWIEQAKRKETREERIYAFIERLKKI